MTAPNTEGPPPDQQLHDAAAAVNTGHQKLREARQTQVDARAAYETARADDPGSAITSRAREAWAATVEAFWRASVDLEASKDQLYAIHRRTFQPGTRQVPLRG